MIKDSLSHSTDIVIFGGGVAGLWLLDRLHQEGYRAILLESDALGSGQTIASQGIIHGGLKYALRGSLAGAANVIAAMPARWRKCLRGVNRNDNAEAAENACDPDLSDVTVLSDHYYMWSDSSIRSKLKTFLGSKSLQGRVEALAKTDYPKFFAAATVDGTLYQLPDFVVDSNSLIDALKTKQAEHIFQLSTDSVEFSRNSSGKVDALTLNLSGQPLTIETGKILFCAGEGNQQLIEQAGLNTPSSQLRPLNMVYVKQQNLPLVYVHCIGDSFSLTPQLTVTSHRDREGTDVWYLGGELAESGVGKSDEEQIAAARSLTNALFPWVDLATADWHCLRINRAEANINNDYRPDDAFLIEEDNIVVCWPTKLTLTPSLADKIVELLKSSPINTTDQEPAENLNALLKRAPIASAPWD